MKLPGTLSYDVSPRVRMADRTGVPAGRGRQSRRTARPACHALCVLRDRHPRVLGGRDDLAGGTWLAVNEHGVVAGLTNRPSPGGRDPTKRSRGELPLMVVGQRSADDGVAELGRTVRPGQYNPAWLLIGDRRSLYYVELPGDRGPTIRELGTGIHVLENTALGEPSVKVDRVRSQVSAASAKGVSLWSAMASVLGDHSVPLSDGVEIDGDEHWERPAATLASCVHSEDYGTRSAALMRVSSDPDARPEVLIADGPSCIAPFVDVGDRWVI